MISPGLLHKTQQNITKNIVHFYELYGNIHKIYCKTLTIIPYGNLFSFSPPSCIIRA